MDAERSTRERAVAELAAGQHGVVARRQLEEIGLGRGAIASRLAQGRLHAIHRGVYAVGHKAIDTYGRWMAAVLAVGPGAVLSHRSAGCLWRIMDTARAGVEVTFPLRCRRRRAIDPHHARLPPDEVTVHDGIPVTTVPRTLLDLSAVLPAPRLQRAIERAEALRLLDTLSLRTLVERHPRRRGTRALRALLDQADPLSAPTRSELEDRFLGFLARHRLPAPRVNADVRTRAGWMECDFVWTAQRVIVELDGRATHDTAAAFERDRERDRVLAADGWRVIRVTWRQLHDHPERLASDLQALLGEAQPTTWSSLG